MPLATAVLSGERADDGLYIPLIERLQRGSNQPGLLFVGDCTRSALEIRADVVRAHHHSLSPLPLTGTTAKEMATWMREGIATAPGSELAPICRVNDKKQAVLVAQGYEVERTCEVKDGQDPRQWQERVLVIHSPSHAEQQSHGRDKRLANAASKIRALPPPRGRGKRQMTEEGSLVEAIGKGLKAPRVEGLRTDAYVKETACHTQYVGRGRGST
jgi:transposase